MALCYCLITGSCGVVLLSDNWYVWRCVDRRRSRSPVPAYSGRPSYGSGRYSPPPPPPPPSGRRGAPSSKALQISETSLYAELVKQKKIREKALRGVPGFPSTGDNGKVACPVPNAHPVPGAERFPPRVRRRTPPAPLHWQSVHPQDEPWDGWCPYRYISRVSGFCVLNC